MKAKSICLVSITAILMLASVRACDNTPVGSIEVHPTKHQLGAFIEIKGKGFTPGPVKISYCGVPDRGLIEMSIRPTADASGNFDVTDDQRCTTQNHDLAFGTVIIFANNRNGQDPAAVATISTLYWVC